MKQQSHSPESARQLTPIAIEKWRQSWRIDGVTSFWGLKDITNTCKRLRTSQTFGGISSVQWRKGGRSWWLSSVVSSFTVCSNRNRSAIVWFAELRFTVCRSIVRRFITRAARSWFDLLYNWPLIELIFLLNKKQQNQRSESALAMTPFASGKRSALVLLNSLFVCQLYMYEDILLAIFLATDLQTVNFTHQITARADLFIKPLSAKWFSCACQTGSNCLHCPVTALYFGAKSSYCY